MENRSKIIIGIAVVAVLGSAAVLSATRGREGGIEVRTEAIEHRDLVEIVTASGNIRSRRTVDISSDVSARVSQLLIDEGDDVVAGQILLRLEPDQYQAALSRAEAQLAQSQAQEAQQTANLTQAVRDRDRLVQLRARDSLLVSRQQLDDAETRVEVQQALLESARFGVSQAQAGVDESEDRLSKTIFTAPMTGKVTRLNVEEGETVIIGTMNNPGSLVATISDLSVIEVVVQVDETEVSEIALGDSASIRIDAFPDRDFSGTVTEIGNSAINPPSQQQGNQQAAIDFEVVLTLDETDAPLRPDLSATADIVVESRSGVVAVPIIALTVRDADEVGEAVAESELEDIEGVFLVRESTVSFQPIQVGVAGQEYFEVLTGLSSGDIVVAGPYQRIRQLREGDAISVIEDDDGTEDEGS
ncbi:MAG: efflux RND transporter periplasmic adaptor subunit [Gemmatimonadota bacterium]|nr:efflux RND transporter periplasmic adaptor subunit [Gemmatimonadota bacterium]MDE3006308.1 efflux RND transporter periplasmic adaptor subunit [Gemmatimonadota bacterium]MDE3013235.1 efflux RND transporter periplasmic adaptor subunit [Gemmatimonadota bacterium]